MVMSMTGFGIGKAKSKYGIVTAEIKTVNHKFLEISYKLPNGFYFLEDKIKTLLQDGIVRGKIYFNIIYEGRMPKGETIYVDTALAAEYHEKLKKLKKTLKLNTEIELRDIAAFPGIVNMKISEADYEMLWPTIEKAIKEAIKKLNADRLREGKHLAEDLLKRVKKIKKNIDKIKARSVQSLKEYKKKLSEKAKNLLGTQTVSGDKVEAEAVQYAKSSDIAEEITRLIGHGINFENVVKVGGEAGKKLDFIAQEMHREANTIGSKSSDYAIARNVIEVKSEIEKIREQVKNLE